MSRDLPDDVKEKLAKLENYEKRFAELIKSFKKLSAQKKAADAIIREITPLSGIADAEALEAHLRNINTKNELSTAEIKRLSVENQDFSKRLIALENQNEGDTKARDDLAAQLREAKSTATDLHQAVAQKDQEQAATARAVDEIKVQLRDTKDRLLAANRTGTEAHETYQLRISELQTELQTMRADANQAAADKQRLRRLVERLPRGRAVDPNVESVCETVEDLLDDLSSTKEQLNTVAASRADLESSLATLREENETLTQAASAKAVPADAPAVIVMPEDHTRQLAEIAALAADLAVVRAGLQDLPTSDQAARGAHGVTATASLAHDSAPVVAKLETAVTAAREAVAERENQLKERDTRIQALMRAVEEHTKRVTQLEAERDEAIQQSAELTRTCDELRAAVERGRGEHGRAVREWEVQVRDRDERRAALERQVQESDAQRQKAARDLAEAQAKHAEFARTHEATTQQLNAVLEHLAASSEKVVGLTDQLELARRQAKQYRVELQRAQDTLAQAERRTAEAQAQVDQIRTEAKQQLEEAGRASEALTQSRASAESQQADLILAREQLANLQADLTTSRQLFEERTARLDTAQTRLHERETELQQLRTQLEQARTDADRVQQVLRDELASHRLGAMQSIDRVRQELADRAAELTSYRAEVQPRLIGLQAAEAERDTLRDQLAVLRTTVTTLEQEAVQRKLELETVQTQQAQSTAAQRQHTQAMEDLSLREAHWRKVNRDLKDEVRRLQRELRTGSGSGAGTALNGSGSWSSTGGGAGTRSPIPGAVERALSPQLAPSPRQQRPGTPGYYGDRLTRIGGPAPGSTPPAPADAAPVSRRSSAQSGASSPDHHQTNGHDVTPASPTIATGSRLAGRGQAGDNMQQSTSTPIAGHAYPARAPSRLSTSDLPTDGEMVNLEYVRHVILKFLERRDHRNQLVPVLALLLKLTPEETRRLQTA
ncbi:hypothetical protein IWQ60_009637 [Tieghemiomyces parasiticus]|uniref:GRIP domain-containing protein n=1 Tax=Tieghemiomyces parasiticus TaxID=78921 RepID=A0A9W7ZNJ2_9FUNG|nr:hypothetical protein IWQ60_009637 [Tieghemiomyces parasiticus]